MKPLVSILIPAYKAEKFIANTIRSALSQIWADKEIIIVDDGSPDNTLQIAKSFESNRVKVISQENTGACGARNNALKLAQGSYVQWLDADDLLAPDKISQQLRHVDDGQGSRVLLTSSFGTFFFRYQKARFNPNSLWQDLGPIDWIITKFVENSWMNPASWLVSRELSESAGIWDERLSSSGDDDGEYICRIVASSEKVKFVPEAKCYYRIGHTDSLSRRGSDKAYESIILVTELYIEHLLSLEESKRTKAACISLLENQLIYFFPDKLELVEKLENMSRTLGGDTLHLPIREYKNLLLFGKYFGWRNAKLVKKLWSKTLTSTHKNWDRLLYSVLDK